MFLHQLGGTGLGKVFVGIDRRPIPETARETGIRNDTIDGDFGTAG